MFLFLRREEGQGLAEYALIGTLIAVVAVLALMIMGGNLVKLLSVIGKATLRKHSPGEKTDRICGPFFLCQRLVQSDLWRHKCRTAANCAG